MKSRDNLKPTSERGKNKQTKNFKQMCFYSPIQLPMHKHCQMKHIVGFSPGKCLRFPSKYVFLNLGLYPFCEHIM